MFHRAGHPARPSRWRALGRVAARAAAGPATGDWLFIIDPPDRGVGAGQFPQNQWFCLQWQYRFAGAGQDNTFVANGGNIATELWVDDIAFGETPIACPAPK